MDSSTRPTWPDGPHGVVNLIDSGGRIARGYNDFKRGLSTPFDVGTIATDAFSTSDLAHARRFWTARIVSEHRSVAVFAQLAVQLIEAGAPLDATTVVLRMAADELVHTEVCAAVVVALGGKASVERDLTAAPLARHAGVSPLARALRNTVYATCMSEMVSVAMLADSLENCGEPGIRSALRAILADEVMHGQFGFLFLDVLQQQQMLDDPLRADLTSYLQHAFAVLEREMVQGAKGSCSPGAVALGVLSAARGHELFYAVVRDAIVPGLEARGIRAANAWESRKLLV